MQLTVFKCYKAHWLLLVLLTFSGYCYAQKQGNIWYFGEGLGLDFNQVPAAVLTDGQIDKDALHYEFFSEGCSSISNSEGELVFYTNGEYIWNRNHKVMLNGSGLMGHHSSTNAGLIVPVPGKNAMYYVFTTDAFQVGLTNGLRYSIVDMCGDDGLGAVLTKNVPLLNTSGERLAIAKHANGVDFWLVAHLHFSTAFYAYLITEEGIGDPEISEIGTYHGRDGTQDGIGQMKISPDGSRLALVLENRSPDVIDLFDFNSALGKVSNYRDLSFVGSQYGGFYGISFSPDNSKLYVNGSTGLFQFSLDSGDGSADAILQTRYSVPLLVRTSSGLQLGPDGKIYLIRNEYVSIITEPNLTGAACNFIDNAIYLLGKHTLYSFPSFLDSFDYPNKDFSPIDIDLKNEVTLCPGESAEIDASVTGNNISYTWQDGSVQPKYIAEIPGLYWVVISNEFCVVKEEITVSPVAVTSLGPDRTACNDDIALVNAYTEGAFYQWQDGSRDPVQLVSHTGTYWVDISKDECTLRDSIYIEFFSRPVFSLGKDTTLCGEQNLELAINVQSDHYRWQDGSENQSFIVKEAGDYSATASLHGCEYTDAITVDYTIVPKPDLGRDTLLCAGNVFTIIPGFEDFDHQWSNGNPESIFSISESGTYWLNLSLGSCSATDTIQVQFVNCVLEMPNVFTPNRDEYNSHFIPMKMTGIRSGRLIIYNRWGSEIFHTDDLEIGWDGITNTNESASGTYYWKVQYTDISGQVNIIKGTILLIR